MRIAYLDCSTGISGDMTLAALLDVGVDAAAIRAGIDSLNLPGVELEIQTVIKGGFRATYVQVKHPEQHAHRHFGDIQELITQSDVLTDSQQDLALQIFRAVATAEARVHGSTIAKVHFHEVGAIDSIVDIVGAAIGFDLLNVDQIIASRIPTGRGQISIDHGICTVPAPGTAELLVGIPLVDVPVEAELTTPTGAAILTTLVDRFGHLPEMTIDRIGYGAGTMNFPNRANLLRMFLGTATTATDSERVCLLETNLDDVTGEVVGYTKQKLLQAGALDVFNTAIQMKKDRPGVILSVIARPHEVEALESILFEETATFGIRRHWVERSTRTREQHTVDTPFGPVLGKLGWHSGRSVFTPEFEDCAKLAAEHGVALREIYRAAETCYMLQPVETDGQHSHTHDHDHDSHSHDHDSHSHDDHHHDHDGHSHDHHHDHDGHHDGHDHDGHSHDH